MSAVQFRLLTGRFYRIAFAADGGRLLEGARSPEGRFHRSGQPAFYLSPRPDWAAAATRVYRRPGDEPRIVAALDVTGVHIVDLRDVYQCRALAIDQRWPSVPWRPQRAAGDAATTWAASDAVRAVGADGMIYAARSMPARWHVVLFRWTGGRVAVAAGVPTKPLDEWVCP